MMLRFGFVVVTLLLRFGGGWGDVKILVCC